MNTLEHLWRSYILPREHRISDNSEYIRISAEACACLQTAWAELSRDGKQAYDEYCYKQSALNTITERDRFLEGFRLGAGIMLELLRPQGDEPQGVT